MDRSSDFSKSIDIFFDRGGMDLYHGGAMKCPRCVQKIHRGAESCPHCGFSLSIADQQLGAEEVVVRALTDAAGLLRRAERDTVQKAIDRFSRRFPQLFFAVYIGSFREAANLRQFGFWLLNKGAFEDVEVSRPNSAGILLVMDVESKSVGLSFGYLLDAYLDEEDTFSCLSKAHPLLLERRHSDGIVTVIKQLSKTLVRKHGMVRKDPEKFERKVQPSPQVGDMVKRIRSGHRKPRHTEEVDS